MFVRIKRFFADIVMVLSFCIIAFSPGETACAEGSKVDYFINEMDAATNGSFERGITIGTDGDIYVLNNKSKLLIYDKNGNKKSELDYPTKNGGNLVTAKNGTVIGCYPGYTNIYFYRPGVDAKVQSSTLDGSAKALAVDDKGNLYALGTVLLPDGNQIGSIYRYSASQIENIKPGATLTRDKYYWVYYVKALWPKRYPSAFCIDKNGYAYIAENDNLNSEKKIYKCNLNVGTNDFVKVEENDVTELLFDSTGTAGLYGINGMVVDSVGNVILTARKSYTIATFAPGTAVATLNALAGGYAEGIAVDGQDNIYFIHNYMGSSAIGKYALSNVHVENIVMPADASVKAGEKVSVAAVVSPVDATNTAVSYKSSDETVAAVDASGMVTGVKEGTAVITAVSYEGNHKAVCTVTVTEDKEDFEKEPPETEDKKDSGKEPLETGKKAQGIKISPKTKTIKASDVKKKAKTYTFKVTGAKTGLSFVKLTSAQKKAIKSVKISKSNVEVTVKKKAKKGSYKIKVYAKSNNKYMASDQKTLTVKIK